MDEKTLYFDELGLSEAILKSVADMNYVLPTPIQAGVIPVMMSGKDVIGQAQTGTGKTAAFALPILEKIDIDLNEPQALILTPTRELAIQVCDAFKQFAAHMPGLKTLAVYGGQEYGIQLRALVRGVQVVVGTPGRIMDHIDRGTLSLGAVKIVVLDEADEMLDMGFKEDVEWVLERAPFKRQTALFSATMPDDIRALSARFLNKPEEITIKLKTATVEATRQRYWLVTGLHKIDALARLLETEPYDAILIFAGRKVDTLEIADQLALRGFNAVALNGDIPQNQRERIIDQYKTGKINIVVATDVAARGLDVDRITHVINYDLPQDIESYIHRIGRTGRAGKSGEAIIFITSREKRWLQMVEKVTHQPIEPMQMPSAADISFVRTKKFRAMLDETLESKDLDFFKNLLIEYCDEKEADAFDVAAALAKIAQKDSPLQIKDIKSQKEQKPVDEFEPKTPVAVREKRRRDDEPEEGMETYRIEVGRLNGATPAHIVGAVAGETGMASRYIGRIRLFDDFSLVDLPEGMPDEMIEKLKTAYVCRRQMRISLDRKSAELRKNSSESSVSLNAEQLKKGGFKKTWEQKQEELKAKEKKPEAEKTENKDTYIGFESFDEFEEIDNSKRKHAKKTASSMFYEISSKNDKREKAKKTKTELKAEKKLSKKDNKKQSIAKQLDKKYSKSKSKVPNKFGKYGVVKKRKK